MQHSVADYLNLSTEVRALNQVFATVKYGADGRITAANPHFLRMLGYDLSELVGKDEAMFFPDAADAAIQADLWEALRSGQARELTDRWVTRAGVELWLQSHYVPITNEQGTVEEILQIVSDVTEQQTREAYERGQIDAINAARAVVHFSLDGFILDANTRFLDATGYTLEEIRGRHHSMFIDDADRDDNNDLWAAMARGEHRIGECRRLRKDGSDIWLHALYSPISDPSGRPVRVVTYASDITQEKLRQADYEWQINAIEKSNCVVTFDMYGTILDANDRFLDATGYTLAEIQGRHHKIFVENAHRHSAQYANFWSDLRKGLHRSGVFKRYAKDGSDVWLHALYSPISDPSGRLVKVIKYATIVTGERLVQAEQEGQIAAIHNAQCVVSFALDGTILDANDNFLEATGYRFGDVRGRHHSMFVDPDYATSEEYREFWADLAQGNFRSGEYKLIGEDGREVWLQATYNPILDLSGRPFKVIEYATDVTQTKLLHADFQGQIEAIHKSQGVAIFDLDGTILDLNGNFLDMLGYSLDEIRGRHHSMLIEKDVAAGPDYHSFWHKLRSGSYHSGMYKRIGKNGREIWIQASYNPIFDLNGNPHKVIKYATDVSSNVALAQAFDDAKRQAQHDSATSLPNRVKLSAFMENGLAGPAGSMVVFYLDLDRFKPINDTFGHHVGDRVLGEVADRMRRALREDQIVARVGGDEFVIAAPGMPTEAIERFCSKIQDIVKAPICHEGADLTVGVSIGVAISPADGTTPDELLRAADAALYRSKENGRGQYSFFSTDMNDKIVIQRQLAEGMRNGLAAGDFYLEYQPRFDARARHIRSVEALVRWAHPERGRISPAEFIPVAEQNGLIIPLGDWIMRTACETATHWNGIGISVNVSPVQFRDGNLVQKIRDCLAETGLKPELLELEITEGVLLEDGERAIGILAELKDIGVKLAMDDFGTGYSSLSYLRNYPFDVIKIDRSFIGDLDTRANARSIVQAILGLGKALGISVTAEGVETNEQLAILTADQCAEVQGFLLARPMRAEQISELLKEIPELTHRSSNTEKLAS